MLRKILKKFVRICMTPKLFGRPKPAEIIIYDKVGSEKLLRFLFDGVEAEVIPTRNEEISIPCAILSLFFVRYSKFGKASLRNLIFDAYIDSWIALCKPSLVATFIDNDPRFYTISSRWKYHNIKTISIQNGARDINFEHDTLSFMRKNNLTKLECDILAVLGSVNIPIYSRYINARFIEYGSLINNHTLQVHAHTKRKKTQRVLFISQYRNSLINTGFYSSEKHLLPILSQWCIRKGLELNVLGCCSQEEVNLERQFYSKMIESPNGFKYLTKSDSLKNQYCQLDDSQLVVAVDSTLGLEALARRCKTTFYVDSTTDQPQPRLGIERDLLINKKIAFFIDLYSEKIICSQLDSLIDMPCEAWLKKLEKIDNQVMALDECSKRLRVELNSILEKDIFKETHESL